MKQASTHKTKRALCTPAIGHSWSPKGPRSLDACSLVGNSVCTARPWPPQALPPAPALVGTS